MHSSTHKNLEQAAVLLGQYRTIEDLLESKGLGQIIPSLDLGILLYLNIHYGGHFYDIIPHQLFDSLRQDLLMGLRAPGHFEDRHFPPSYSVNYGDISFRIFGIPHPFGKYRFSREMYQYLRHSIIELSEQASNQGIFLQESVGKYFKINNRIMISLSDRSDTIDMMDSLFKYLNTHPKMPLRVHTSTRNGTTGVISQVRNLERIQYFHNYLKSRWSRRRLYSLTDKLQAAALSDIKMFHFIRDVFPLINKLPPEVETEEKFWAGYFQISRSKRIAEMLRTESDKKRLNEIYSIVTLCHAARVAYFLNHP